MEQVRPARLLAATRASERVPVPGNPLDPLSEREREIVQLVSTGLSNKEIGIRLGISHWTVSTHLRRVFAKLEVNRRIELCHFTGVATF